MENPSSSKLTPSTDIADPTRNWLELPSELTADILHRLGAIEILESAQKVCTAWRKICKDPAMWRIIDMWNLGNLHSMPHDLEIMCKHAVDRSEGQLIDINFEYFGFIELLDYIVERSSQLRRLQISCCYGSFHELGKAVKKLPSLEELSLNFTEIPEEGIEIVGRFCPQLKTFKLNTEWYDFSDTSEFPCDSVAFAIAENMPRLRELELIGNEMTDKGLKKILDGCDRLESLDLRLCKNLKFEGSLGKRCSEQIKDLKCPNDSLKGCRFAFGGNDHFPKSVLPCHYGHCDDDDDDDDDDDYDYSEHIDGGSYGRDYNLEMMEGFEW